MGLICLRSSFACLACLLACLRGFVGAQTDLLLPICRECKKKTENTISNNTMENIIINKNTMEKYTK